MIRSRKDPPPTLEEENALLARGCRFIAGVDEVGRGPLAGLVMAAAVILPLDNELPWLCKVRDSKQLTPKQREELCRDIRRDALAVATGKVCVREIDALGIAEAARIAMELAIQTLPLKPDYLLIDGFPLPQVPIPQKAIIKGDSRCLSIAAASIVAKVARDSIMVEMDVRYPGYGFAQNKGYGTESHLLTLRERGPCPIHRRSFLPVRQAGSPVSALAEAA